MISKMIRSKACFDWFIFYPIQNSLWR